MSSSNGTFMRAIAGRTGKLIGVGLAGLIVLSSQSGAWAGIADPSTSDPSVLSTVSATEPSGDYIVRFATGVSDAQQHDDLAAAGATITNDVAPLNLYSVSLTDSAVTALRADPDVLGVEIDKVREVQGAPSDPAYADQWALPKIGWDSAYGSIDVTGTATVAVLDTGVNATDDLSGQLLDGASMIEGVAGTGDPNGHGTAMASIVAADTDNATGIAGVGYQGVSVMPVKVLGVDGTGQDSDIVRGVVYAADHGADVILMSFANPGRSAALQSAADYAWSKGAVLVAATGNDGSTVDTFPAGLAKVVGVSATDRDDTLWTGSNSGADTFLAAPGVDIATGSGSVTGTSASAAIVAGAAALVKAHDPSASNDVVVGRLARDADVAGSVSDTGNGRLNLARALEDTSTDPVVPQGVTGSGGPIVGPYVAASKAMISGTVTSTATGHPAIAGATVSCTNNCTDGPVVTDSSGRYSLMTNYAGNAILTLTASAPGFTSQALTITPGNGNPLPQTLDFSLTPSCAGPSVTTNPTAQSITYGDNASFTASASGSPAPTVQWQVNSGTGFTNVGAASTGTLSLTQPTVAASGNVYRAVFTNSCGSVTSNNALLTVARKNLTISGAAAQSRPYDATKAAIVDFSHASLLGVVPGDGVSIDSSGYSATFADKAIGGDKPVTVTGVGLGGGAVMNNYTVSQPTGLTANITRFGLTIGGLDVASKPYDGTASAAMTGTAQLVGVQGTDNVSLDAGAAAASFRTVGVGNAKPVDVSGYAISGPDADNYTLTQPTGLSADITPAPLTVVPETAHKTYGDVAPPAAYHLSGFVKDETRSTAGVTGAPVCAIGSHEDGAGTYHGVVTCTVGSLGAANYSFTAGPAADLEITPALLTVVPSSALKTYGAADPDPTYALRGFVNVENRESAGVTGDAGCLIGGHGNHVGTYLGVITCTVGNLSAANYSFATGVAADLVVNPAVLTIVPGKAMKTYGDDDPAPAYQLTGFVNHEDELSAGVQGAADCAIASHGEDAGTYDGKVTCAVGSLEAADYTFTAGAAADVVIEQAVLDVDAKPESKTYGDPDPGLTYFLSGFVKGEKAGDMTITGSADCSRDPGQAVGHYTITCLPHDLATKNYSFVAGDTAQLVIGRAELRVNAVGASKTYGQDDPELTWTLSGFVPGDSDGTAGVDGDASCSRAPGEGAGSHTITCVPGDLAAANYSFVTGDTAELEVRKAVLTVVPDQASKTYGDDDPDPTYHLTGFVNGEDETAADVTGAARCSIASHAGGAGTYTDVVTCTTSDLDAPNYSFDVGHAADLVIKKSPLTLKADPLKRTYGDDNPTLTFSVEGLVDHDSVGTALTSDPELSTTADKGSPIGDYPITIAGGASDNYALSYADSSLTVEKAPLTITADDQSKVYGNGNPVLTGTIDGIKNGDAITASYSTAADETSGVGGYAIAPAAVESAPKKLDNYQVTLVDGTLTVKTRALTITAYDRSKTYGDELLLGGSAFSTGAGELVNGDTVASVTVVSGGAAATAFKGQYPVTPSAAVAGPDTELSNYAITYAAGQLTVDAAPLTVTADDLSRVYGDANPVLTGTVVGLKNGDAISASYSTPAVTASGVAGYAIVPAAVDSTPGRLSNYDVTLVNGTLTVTKAPLTVTADDLSRVYGDANPVLTGKVVGLKNGDAISASYSTTAVTASGVGGYPIVPAAVDSTPGRLSNYDVTLVNGTLTVTKAPLTVTANDATKLLNAANPPFTATIVGAQNGDVVTPTFLTGATTTSPVGRYTIVPSVTLLTSTTVLANYSVTLRDGTLTVVYGWNGYLQPVNDTAHQVGVTESKFKLGQTIPLKFDLTDANGVSVQQPGSPAFAKSANRGACDANAAVDSVPTVAADTAAVYGYTGGHYQYNWSTKGLTAGEYKVFANLADGTNQYTYICLTK